MLRCEHGRANAPFLSLMGTYRMSLRTVKSDKPKGTGSAYQQDKSSGKKG